MIIGNNVTGRNGTGKNDTDKNGTSGKIVKNGTKQKWIDAFRGCNSCIIRSVVMVFIWYRIISRLVAMLPLLKDVFLTDFHLIVVDLAIYLVYMNPWKQISFPLLLAITSTIGL